MIDADAVRDDGTRRSGGADAGGIVVGSFVGLAGALFLVQPFVTVVVLGPLRAPPVALSAVTFAVGFCLGGVVFLRQGRRLMGIGHAGTGVGWALVLAGTVTGSATALFLGAAGIAGTAFFLVARARK